jgi:hypothetical protein
MGSYRVLLRHGKELELKMKAMKPLKGWAVMLDGEILTAETGLVIYRVRKEAEGMKRRMRRDLKIKPKIVRITIYFCDPEKPF